MKTNIIKIESNFGRSFDLELSPELPHDCFIVWNCEGNYEPEVSRVFAHVLKEGDLAIDVGANLGFHTICMAQCVGETGHVIALEPVPENRKRLEGHLRLNKIDNVEVLPCAAWVDDAKLTIYKNFDDITSSCVWDPALWRENKKCQISPEERIEVKAVTLDSIAGKPKLIKIDTEGADYLILRGARRILDEGTVVISELNPFGMTQLKHDAETFRAFMREFSYEMFLLHSDDRLPTYCPKEIAVQYTNECVVKNVMFARMESLIKFWPETYE